jgi:HEAT repeat protein
MKYTKKTAFPALLAAALLVIAVGLLALSSRTSVRNHRLEDLAYAVDNGDTVVRLGAIVELVEYGQSGIPILNKALRDADQTIKRTAMAALASIGGHQAAEALSETLSDPDPGIRIRGILALASTGNPGVPYLFKVLDTGESVRVKTFAAYGLARAARPGITPEIMNRFDAQTKATQMHLIPALIRVGDDEAYAALSRLMQSPDPVLRYYVASSIADAPAKRALPILVSALEDEAYEVRMWGMFSLEQLNAPESYPIVVAALHDESDYVRKEAAYTLGLLGNRAAVPHLTACLKDPYHMVRHDAAESLGKLGDPQAVPRLEPLLIDVHPLVRIGAAEALARLNDYCGMDMLIDCLNLPHQQYRIVASQALCNITNQDFGRDYQAWSAWWDQAKKTMLTKQAGKHG